jgi:hypothetical protein
MSDICSFSTRIIFNRPPRCPGMTNDMVFLLWIVFIVNPLVVTQFWPTYFYFNFKEGKSWKLKDLGFGCKDSESSRTRLEITISSPKTTSFQSSVVRHLHLQSIERPPAKKETKVWSTSILVLSKHRKAFVIFMIITTQRDKD